MALRTVNDAFELVTSRGPAPAWQWYDANGQWTAITSAEIYGRVRALAATPRSLGHPARATGSP